MAGDKISRVAAIGTGTIGASWTVVFLARGLTVAASDPAPGAETFCMSLSARLGQASRDCRHYLPPPWAALTFHTEPEAALAGADLVQEVLPSARS